MAGPGVRDGSGNRIRRGDGASQREESHQKARKGKRKHSLFSIPHNSRNAHYFLYHKTAGTYIMDI